MTKEDLKKLEEIRDKVQVLDEADYDEDNINELYTSLDDACGIMAEMLGEE